MATERVLIFTDSLAIELDAVLSEGHDAKSEATAHPVERGIDVSDHIRPQPRTLEIVGVVSDYPIRPAGAQAQDYIASEAARLDRTERMGRLVAIAGPLGGLVPREERVPPPALPNPHAGRAEQAWADLDRLRVEARLVSVVTGLVDYPRMAIVGLTHRRAAGSDDLLEVTISLVEVFTVDSRSAEIPAELLKPKNMGHQTARPATPAQAQQATQAADNRSGAKRIADFLRGR